MEFKTLHRIIKTGLLLVILFQAIITNLLAQPTDLRGSKAFCNPPAKSFKSVTPGVNGSAAQRAIAQSRVIFNTDFVSAGVGGLRNVGSGQIVLSGISGTVTRAYLYWSGVTNSITDVGGSIMVNAVPVTGTSIGVSNDNCWGFNNSQAYRANITGLVQSTGNGTYNLSGFGDLNPNGASLIVFFHDADNSNNRDVVLFDGNDSNVPFAGIASNPDAPEDPSGWNVLLSGINYTSGTINIHLHVAGGQTFVDDALKLDTLTLVPTGHIFDGNTVPAANNGPTNNGRLWDIRSFNITTFLTPGPNTLTLTSSNSSGNDCLSLIAVLVDLPAGSAPPAVYYSKLSGDLHKVLTWGLNPDGSGNNPADFDEGQVFNLANRPSIYTMTYTWTVGGIINIPAGSQLQLNGNLLSEAGLTGTGTISGSPTSSLFITGTTGGGAGLLWFTTGTEALQQLRFYRSGLGATVTLGTPLTIYGVLGVHGGGTLNTDNKLTLKSTAAQTAYVAPVTGIISGTTTVERYIPARRAWRMINAPVASGQTISQAWQEGAANTTDNPHPGYGTHITGGPVYGSALYGFDVHAGAESSLKFFDTVTNRWLPVPTTNANLVGITPYMLFVRGDRSLVLGGATLAPTNTTLRVTGFLLTGNQTYPVNTTGFTALVNPYQAPINFASLTRSNVQNLFYVWDPKLGGTYGRGAYVTVSWNGSAYDVTPAPVSPESQYIQPWQSFLVRSTGSAGTITIKESDKNGPINNVYRTSGNQVAGANPDNVSLPDNSIASFRVRLQLPNEANATVLDEVLTTYSSNYSNKVDELDAEKMTNVEENLAIVRSGKSLAIERRGEVNASDTMFLQLSNTSQRSYLFQFNSANLSAATYTAVLEDQYLHTITPIDLGSSTQVAFTISADAASQRSDRFRVVFVPGKGAAITEAGESKVKVYPNPVQGNTVQVQLTNVPQGVYQVQLLNMAGQVLLQKSLTHAGGTATYSIELANRPAKGMYHLQVSSKTFQGSTKVSFE